MENKIKGWESDGNRKCIGRIYIREDKEVEFEFPHTQLLPVVIDAVAVIQYRLLRAFLLYKIKQDIINEKEA